VQEQNPLGRPANEFSGRGYYPPIEEQKSTPIPQRSQPQPSFSNLSLDTLSQRLIESVNMVKDLMAQKRTLSETLDRMGDQANS